MMTRNLHYDLGEWIDFARGLSTPERRRELEGHASECSECSEVLQLFIDLWSAARELRKNTAPEAWSGAAEQIYVREFLDPIRRLPVRTAALGFDSFSGLVPMGVRSESHGVRHFTYEAPGVALDLKLEGRTEDRSLSIIGQITDRRDERMSLATTPVFLFAGERLVAQTAANEFGEFQVTCRPKRRMRISFPFDGFRVDVKLNTLDEHDE